MECMIRHFKEMNRQLVHQAQQEAYHSLYYSYPLESAATNGSGTSRMHSSPTTKTQGLE